MTKHKLTLFQSQTYLVPWADQLQEKIPALCFLLGPTRMGSSAQRPKIENRKLAELIFLTPPKANHGTRMDENTGEV